MLRATSTGTANETLIRLLAASVALGLPIALFWRSDPRPGGDAKHDAMRGALEVVVRAVEKYRLETGLWPDGEQGLDVLTDGVAAPTASYYVVPALLRDPWGRPWRFAAPGAGGALFELISHGADGQPGGVGDDRDIRSTEK